MYIYIYLCKILSSRIGLYEGSSCLEYDTVLTGKVTEIQQSLLPLPSESKMSETLIFVPENILNNAPNLQEIYVVFFTNELP
jgi:hypothetical protein